MITEVSTINLPNFSGGKELHRVIKEKDRVNKHTSYISEPWFAMYLKDRAPLPVNYNPILIMNHDKRPEYNDQILRSANVIVSSLRFMKSLKSELLVPEIYHMDPSKTDTEEFRRKIKMFPEFMATYAAYFYKAYPLDMSQFIGLFGATRIPKRDKDEIFRSDRSRHVLVMKNGNFYSMDVLDENGNILEPEVIYSHLNYLNNLPTSPADATLGSLTTQNRKTWAAARKHIVSLSERNQQNMAQIDSALFCLCLDNSTFNESNPVPTVRKFLFDEHSNRWYDKSFSVLVDQSGTVGVNFEHSWGDGVAVLRYFNEIYKEISNNPFLSPSSQKSVKVAESSVRFLEFDFDEKSKNFISESVDNHNSVINSIDMNFLKYFDINKGVCKKSRVSPDSLMQLSFQMAYYLQKGKFVGTYESCSTSAFRHGRTETMRPCTMETKDFVEKIFSNNRPSDSDLRQLLLKCSAKHNELTKNAAMGQGFDRHLYALRNTAEKIRVIDQHGIFSDPAYARINHNIISTSTLSSSGLLAGGFGPVVKDGYGVGYNIQDDFLGCIVSNYKNESNGKEFINCLTKSYDVLSKLVKV